MEDRLYDTLKLFFSIPGINQDCMITGSADNYLQKISDHFPNDIDILYWMSDEEFDFKYREIISNMNFPITLDIFHSTYAYDLTKFRYYIFYNGLIVPVLSSKIEYFTLRWRDKYLSQKKPWKTQKNRESLDKFEKEFMINVDLIENFKYEDYL